MRSTLFGSALLVLSFGMLGCEDTTKKPAGDAAPVVAPAPTTETPATTDTAKPAMEAKGAMDGPAPTIPVTPEPAAPTPTPEESKKEEMPK